MKPAAAEQPSKIGKKRPGRVRATVSAGSRRPAALTFRLGEIMAERNLTYADVSRMTEIPTSTLSDMGRGKIAVPGAVHLVQLCRAFKVQPGELLQVDVKK